MPQLDSDRLVFDNSKPGDYELISLADFTFGEQTFEVNASLDVEGRLVRGDAESEGAGADAHAAVPGPADPEPDAFELVYPQAVGVHMAPARIRRAIRTATRQLPRRCMPSPRTEPPRRACLWTRLAMMRSRMARR